MKALLICPSKRPGVEALCAQSSLATWQFFGASLVGHWMEYLAVRGFKEVTVLASGDAEAVKAQVQDGARWGLGAEVVSEASELCAEEAARRHGPAYQVFVAETLPGHPSYPLFGSYTQLQAAVRAAFFTLARRKRVGAREIQAGVWVGLRTHIGPEVTFEGPCWLGEDVHVEKRAHIGAWSVLEDRVWVGAGAEVRESIVAPETSLGVATSLRRSIAQGNVLIDWKTNSVTEVADSFLLCHLRATPFSQRIRRVFARLAEAAAQEGRVALPAPIRIPTTLGGA